MQPTLKYGFPALSPGGYIENARMDEAAFYAAARPAAMQCDWIGVHCYWLDDAGMLADADGGHYRTYKNEGSHSSFRVSNPGPQSKAMAPHYKEILPDYVVGPIRLFQVQRQQPHRDMGNSRFRGCRHHEARFSRDHGNAIWLGLVWGERALTIAGLSSLFAVFARARRGGVGVVRCGRRRNIVADMDRAIY
jgi:hypothetical protein